MVTSAQAADKEMSAGLYLRAIRQIWSWSWGWGKKKLTNVSDVETERPWAGVAEWLRVAHSLLDDKAVELTRSADR